MGRGKKHDGLASPRNAVSALRKQTARAVPRVLGEVPAPHPPGKARAEVDTLFLRMFQIAILEDRHYSALPESNLASEPFCEYFAGKLVEAHVVNRYRVEGRPFETLFAGASRIAGRDAFLARSLTHAGHDAIVDDERFQLKTEASKKIDPGHITISKLMESAGTKGIKTREDAAAFLPHISRHLSRYDRVVIMRAFDQTSKEGTRGVRYELVEIPKTLLQAIKRLQPDDFSEPRASGHTKATVLLRGKPAFDLVFDGSDNKITLRKIRVDLCTVHAVFWVPYGEEIVRGAGDDALAFEARG